MRQRAVGFQVHRIKYWLFLPMPFYRQQVILKSLFSIFLRLGLTAFGGPAAHLVIMKQELVDRRRWFSDKSFMQLWALTQLIPGPNSTELAIHVGLKRAGLRGMCITGLSFIVPAVILTTVIAALYGEFSALPYVAPFIFGVQAAVIAVVIWALKPYITGIVYSLPEAILFVVSLLLSFLGISELPILFGSAAIWALSAGRFNRTFTLALPAAVSLSGWGLFGSFFKIGALLYGSGYVLFSFFHTEFVETGLMPAQVLTDAIAVGQITPGPVFSSAAFVGFWLDGWSGAALASLGIFLPSFIWVYVLHYSFQKLPNHPAVSRALSALNTASVALILHTCFEMFWPHRTEWPFSALMVASGLVLVLLPKLNNVWILLGAGLLAQCLWLFHLI